MNIAFYIPVLNVGGAEKVIINLLKQLSLDHKNKYYLITDLNHSIWIDNVDHKVTILDIPEKTTFFNRLLAIKMSIQINKIDLVVSHLTHANIHCLLLKIFFSFKLIIVEHNIVSTYIKDFPKLTLKFNLLIRMLFNRANKIIAVSNVCKNDMVNNFNVLDSLCEVVYNPFDFTQISSLSSEPIVDDLLTKIRNRNFIVAVSRLEIQKNTLFLVDTLHDFLKEQDLVLVLIGGGSLKKVIEDRILDLGLLDHVFLTGNINNPYPLISQASLLVHPSKFEGFGLVLIESIYLETPVIAMNFEVAFEILENGRLGTIFADKTSFLQAMGTNFLTHEKNSKEYSNYVKDRYNLEVISNQYMEIILSTLNSR
jgi:glycosyltransferase involved in cell wall biosynthesis